MPMKRWTNVSPHLAQNTLGECNGESRALPVIPIKASLSGDWITAPLACAGDATMDQMSFVISEGIHFPWLEL